MILQALVHLYDELCMQGKIAEEGWGVAKVTHRIILGEDGSLRGIISARKKVQKGKKEVEEPIKMLVPLPSERSGKKRKSSYLCDNGKYFLGIDPKGKTDKEALLECFNAAKKQHHELLDNCSSNVAQGILRFFDTWNVYNAEENIILKRNWKDLSTASGFIFQVDGKDALQSIEIRNSWNKYYQAGKESKDKEYGVCLITGLEKQPISRLHPMIKGVVGTASSGAKVVSFNAEAFCSYGYDNKQGENSPVSEKAAFGYGAALNYLLADKTHAKKMGDDITVVYWSEHAINACQDCFLNFLDESESGMDDASLNSIMEKLRNGLPASLDGIEILPDEPFYVLGLSPSKARLSVRFFFQNTFGEIMMHLVAHQERLRISGASWEREMIPLWKLIKAAEDPHSDKTGLSPLLAGSLMRSVLQDSRYPETLFQHVMMRIFADRDKKDDKGKNIWKIGHERAAFIKAYLLKNGSQKWREIIQMAVNKETKEISYVLGRLFSVLENIQESANPGINATIKDRYFNAACATPAVTFPVLFKLSNAHLRKLESGKVVYFSKKLQELTDKLVMPDVGQPFPRRLSLEEQGAFVIGYYQETQARFTKKEETENE